MRYIYLITLFSISLGAVDYRSLLFHGNCITCHFEHKSISAPSIMKVKDSYLRAFPKKEDFVKYMSEWVLKPNKGTSIMLDEIEKHELMPELGYDLSTLEEISAYIYDTDFTQRHEGHK